LFTDDQVVNFYVVIYTSKCKNWKKLQIPQNHVGKTDIFSVFAVGKTNKL